MATTRSGHEERGKDTEFEFYLKSGLPSSQIVSMLELQKKDRKEIDAFIAKYDAARKKIAKLIKKGLVILISPKLSDLLTECIRHVNFYIQ